MKLLTIAIPIVSVLMQPTQTSTQAQAPGTSAQVPQFEVASIKPNKSDNGMRSIVFTPDGMTMVGVTVQILFRNAFDLGDDRILGTPGWVKSEAYDIEAKVDGPDAPKLEKLTPGQRMSMLLPLLTDRFGLKFHHETKELPMYALVIAKGGPKLKEIGYNPP
jgi:bla regulator protein blaR1